MTKVDIDVRPYTVWVGGTDLQNSFSDRIQQVLTGLPNELGPIGRGVSACALCDGAFFRNQRVVVGGEESQQWRRQIFSHVFCEVILISRREEFRASKIMIDRTFRKSKSKGHLQHGCGRRAWREPGPRSKT